MEHEEPNFSDPALKAAVRKAWAGETAPAELRQRIGRLVAAESARQPSPSPRPTFVPPNRPKRFSNWPVFVTAAAALVFLTVGSVGYRLFHSDSNPASRITRVTPSQPGQTTEHVLPAEAVAEMISTHDVCTAKPDHHGLPGIAPNDFTRIGQALAIRVGIPVASMPLDGWTFKGGACCDVGANAAGHLVYRHGDQALSVFSVNAAPFRLDHADGLYEAQQDCHMLAGFVKGNGLYCLVGSSPDGSLTPQELDALRTGFESSLVAAPGGAAPAARAADDATLASLPTPAR